MQNHGVKDSALGTAAAGDRVPEWLEKWASLILRFVEEERALLPAQLCAIPPPTAFYTPTSAEIEARGGNYCFKCNSFGNGGLHCSVCTRYVEQGAAPPGQCSDTVRHCPAGVSENRLQNIVITLDKVKRYLRQPGQPLRPPLQPLSDEEVRTITSDAPSIVLSSCSSYECRTSAGRYKGEHHCRAASAARLSPAMSTAPLLFETDRLCGTLTHWHPDADFTDTMTLSRQAARHLWTGERSVMRRLLRGAAGGLADAALSRGISVSVSPEELLRLLQVCK